MYDNDGSDVERRVREWKVSGKTAAQFGDERGIRQTKSLELGASSWADEAAQGASAGVAVGTR